MKKELLKSKKTTLAVLLIPLLYLLVGLTNLDKYGMSWDETFSIKRGESTSLYLESYLKPSGRSFNFDDPLFYHPTFFPTINFWFSKIAKTSLVINPIDSNHILILILFSVGLIFLYLFAKEMFNERVALYSMLFLIFFPRFIAHSIYNPKDIPVTIFSLIALFFLYLTFVKKNYKDAVLAGIFSGISLTTKFEGILIFPIFFVSYLFSLIFDLNVRKCLKLKRELIILITILITSFITVFISWPQLWEGPSLIYKSVKYFLSDFQKNKVLYFGKDYTPTNLPWHYVPVYLVIVTPLITLAFFFVGSFLSLKNLIKKEKILQFSLVLSWLFVPLIAKAYPGIAKYDGIRHFFISVPALTILAGLGLGFSVKKVEFIFPKFKRVISGLVLFLISAVLFSEIMKIHPYEGSYFNGGVRMFIPEHIENYFDIEYWGVTYREGVNWLNKNAEVDSIICVPIENGLIEFYNTRNDLRFECREDSTYLMFFTRKPLLSDIGSTQNYQLVFKISRYNSDLLYIYKIKGV